MVSLSVNANATPVAEYIHLKQRLVSMQHLFRNALAGQSYASWLVLLQNPFPVESFCQHDSGQFPPRKSFLVY